MPSIESVGNKYKNLRMSAISDSLEKLVVQAEGNEISYLEFAELLAEEELTSRDQKRILLNMKRAGFPVVKVLEEFDYRFQTTITKRQISGLLDYSFIENRENLIFIGPPGVGKTHLSIAIGVKAVNAGFKVLFKSAMELVELLDLAEIKGELKKTIRNISKFDLIIIDELGYLPMNKKGVFNLFQLINSLYEYRSIILTTNKDFTAWGDFFIDENVAVPIIDRMIHHSHIFMLGGESYRLRSKTSKS